MGSDRDQDMNPRRQHALHLTRRRLLQGAFAVAGVATASPLTAFAWRRPQREAPRTDSSSSALALARLLNRTKFSDLPPKAVENAKVIIASTLASAAPGSVIDSARIIRDLAKDHGGKPEATVWFDGTKLPVNEVAHINAVLSDAFASDDSDMRNTAHFGTCLTSAGLAVAERAGATGQDVLTAMVVGYDAAGRIGDARQGGRAGVHASQTVAFGGTVTAARLLKLTDEQMAHAIGITAITMGGLGIGTNSWAREYMGGNAAFCAVNSALAAERGYTVNEDMLEAQGGFLTVFGGGKPDTQILTRDYGNDWEITKYLAIKLWPGAHPFSSLVEAAMNAARQANVPANDVAKILVHGRNVAGSRNPKDYAEAIHSLPYFLACAVADKDFTWIHATPAKFHDPAITRLMGLVEADPSAPAVKYQWNWGGTVTVVTTSDARFTSTVDAPKGSAPRGIEWSDIDAKYRALMPDSKMPKQRIEDSLKVIHGFEQVKRVSELTGLLNARS
jgi:2-methylcitrate dehydratase PrpD